ncbi:MAG: hypothetical protein JWQ71_2982 [Pedosphaera sp.]|nr:hypothetical protein [Pedosphaera sp.]
MKHSQPSPRHLRAVDFLRLDGIVIGSFPLQHEDQNLREWRALGHWFNAEGMLINNQGEGSDSKAALDGMPERN